MQRAHEAIRRENKLLINIGSAMRSYIAYTLGVDNISTEEIENFTDAMTNRNKSYNAAKRNSFEVVNILTISHPSRVGPICKLKPRRRIVDCMALSSFYIPQNIVTYQKGHRLAREHPTTVSPSIH